MRARHIWVVAAVAGLAIIGAVIGWTVAGSDDEPATAGGQSRPGAQAVIDAISAKWPAPNARDTSSGCKAKPDSTAPGCVSRVTTDAVTVTELASAADAKHWADANKGSGARQAGRYVLTWTGDQEMTGDETRADMAAIAKQLG